VIIVFPLETDSMMSQSVSNVEMVSQIQGMPVMMETIPVEMDVALHAQSNQGMFAIRPLILTFVLQYVEMGSELPQRSAMMGMSHSKPSLMAV
jgi:hypothetical protein